MSAPRAKRRTAPFRTLEQLGAEMLQFHGGMNDPVYAAGSYYLSGKRHPSRAVEIAADKELTKLYDHPDPTWTKKDMAGLWRAIITMARLLEFDPKSKRDITLRRKAGSRRDSAKDWPDLRKGDRVVHSSLGAGTVFAVPTSHSARVTFDEDGITATVSISALKKNGRTSRDTVGSPEREALLRAVGLSPERGVRYNITTPQLRQMVKSGHRIRVGRDPASGGASPRRVTKKRWTYLVEDLETGQRRSDEPTMKKAKQLARDLSIHSGHPVAVIAVTTVNGKDEWHPQGAYYGTRWRGGAHHYTPRGRR